MTYQELVESLLPDVPGVLIASVRDALGWAVRELCNEADVWLDQIPVAAGENLLDAGADLEVLRVRAVLDGGQPIAQRNYQQPTRTLLIVRASQPGLVAQVAVRPLRIGYESLPDVFVSEHSEALSAGVLAKLYAQPEKPWSNPQAALDRFALFRGHCADARQRAVLGHASGGVRFRPPRFI